jgi:hypothetical protein
MIYQLPNGKVIDISIEEYLELTDYDIQYLMSINAGEYAKSVWHRSVLKKKEKVTIKIVNPDLDYETDDEEIRVDQKIDFDSGYIDRIIDVPDEEESE